MNFLDEELMSKEFMTARGKMLDIDLIKIKHEMLTGEKDGDVKKREEYIDQKRRRSPSSSAKDKNAEEIKRRLQEKKNATTEAKSVEKVEEVEPKKEKTFKKSKRVIKK